MGLSDFITGFRARKQLEEILKLAEDPLYITFFTCCPPDSRKYQSLGFR
jgi:hypothetical protein